MPAGFALLSATFLLVGAVVLMRRSQLVASLMRIDGRRNSLDDDELLTMNVIKVWLVGGTSLAIGVGVFVAAATTA